jgi:phosphatidylserine/phosphatidylglycerophosphate/cardiolipin synthase-like enzyme
VYLTDWQGDADERLAGPGSEIARVLADAAGRSVDVRGLLWRSHPRQIHFAEQSNLELAKTVNASGGELLLDERVRRGGSHHQKVVIVKRADPSGDVAFVGGIDLCHGRHDDEQHAGDPQHALLDHRYGPRPPWHDAQLEVHGPAIDDIEYSFRERWTDLTPLDHRNPARTLVRRFAGQPRSASPLEGDERQRSECGTHTVQVLRTYAAKRPPYPFAPRGERSIARAYEKAFARARALVYIEDQYLWSRDGASFLAAALRREPQLRVIIVVPRFPDRAGRLAGAASRAGRDAVLAKLRAAGGSRVAVYDLENREGTPIYVHAKVCVIDDVWMDVGSDNLNRRSWTHDSELSCAVIDATLDGRSPEDPGGRGDGARRLARDTRLRLLREHLGRDIADDDDLLDPISCFEAVARAARALDEWCDGGAIGERPAGHLRPHRPEDIAATTRLLAEPFYRAILDPDGRPRALRRSGTL